jgi:pimeloyl-ACP methyl ester carboxylesterase
MHGLPAEIEEHARHDETSGDDLLHIFFAHTQTSQAKGKEFLARSTRRSDDRDPTPTLVVREAQYDAMLEWGGPDQAALQLLTAIKSPTLILQGDDDLMSRPRSAT